MSLKPQNRIQSIDFLRGIAIGLIVLFHLNPAWCPNGFWGVDAFLVISGYFLFKGHFTENIERRFSVVEFLRKRICRLVPCMLVAIALGIVVLAICNPPSDYASFWSPLKNAMCARVNIYLDRVSGNYFSASTRLQPLMHLWYIGMYLQAIVAVSVLIAFWERAKVRRRWRIWILGVIGIGSFVVSCRWMVNAVGLGDISWAKSTYYWTSARLWEFAAGGLLGALPVKQNEGELASCAHLFYIPVMLLIGLSFLPLANSVRYAIVPVALTCLAVYNANRVVLPKWLGPCLGIGVVSYSLYAVHWPIIYFVESVCGANLRPMEAAVALVVIAAVTPIVYRIFEKRTIQIIPLVVMYGVLLGVAYWVTHAAQSELTGEEYVPRALAAESPLWKGSEKFGVNLWGAPQTTEPLLWKLGDDRLEPNFVLVGDSHAGRAAIGLDLVGRTNGWCGVYVNSYLFCFYGAQFSEVVAADHTNTQAKHDNFIRYLSMHPQIKYVVVSQWWSHLFVPHRMWDGEVVDGAHVAQARLAELKEFCQRIRATGKQVVVLSDNPTIPTRYPKRTAFLSQRFSAFPNRHAANLFVTKAEFDKSTLQTEVMGRQLQNDGMCRFVDIAEKLFINGIFSVVRPEDVLLYDSNHLTALGAKLAIEGAAAELSAILK